MRVIRFMLICGVIGGALSAPGVHAAIVPADQALLVVGSGTNKVFQYNANGTFAKTFATVNSANGITTGLPGDQTVYVTQAGGINGIQRFDAQGNAVPFGAISSTGTGTAIVEAAFAPDGWLYFTTTSAVKRVQGPTMGSPGTVDGTFNITGANGGAVRGLAIVPDGSASGYLIMYTDRQVYFQHPDGSGSGNFISPGDGSLLVGLHLRSDGKIFTTGYNSPGFAQNGVYSGSALPAGGALTTFVSPVNAAADFTVDNIFDVAGNVYVSDFTNNSVFQYSPTGTLLGAFVTSGLGGLSQPVWMTFLPEPGSATIVVAGASLLLSRRRRAGRKG